MQYVAKSYMNKISIQSDRPNNFNLKEYENSCIIFGFTLSFIFKELLAIIYQHSVKEEYIQLSEKAIKTLLSF